MIPTKTTLLSCDQCIFMFLVFCFFAWENPTSHPPATWGADGETIV